MSRQEFVPQTIGAALDDGWTDLGIACDYCHRGNKVPLAARPRDERIAETARRFYCRTCPDKTVGRSYLRFSLIAEWTSLREKPIGFSGMVAVRVGMN